MSGVIKSVKKVFKKVSKSKVFQVAGIALAAGAAIFTAGAALGVAGMAGGWGGVAASAGQVFGNGVLGGIVTGAVEYAGYGALIGGGISALSGGDFGEGAAMGGLAGGLGGAAYGGISTALEGGTAAAGIGGEAAGGVGPLADGPASAIGGDVGPLDSQFFNSGPAAGGDITGGPFFNPGAASGTGPVPVPVSTGPTIANPAVLSASGESATSGIMAGLSKAAENPIVAGGVVSGIGSGVSGLASAGDAQEAAEIDRETALKLANMESDMAEDERAYIAANYGSGNTPRGLLTGSDVQALRTGQDPRPTPAQRFDPSTYAGRWTFNTATGQLEFVNA